MTDGALRCVGLRKAFGGVAALDNIELTFSESGITAIIGPNGAGKTTLFNTITGLARPDSGDWYLGGTRITYLPLHKIARLGIYRTFQNLRLIRRIAVIDNVVLSCRARFRESILGALSSSISRDETRHRESAQEILKLVDLSEKASEATGALSYGQQKLLSLACSIASEAPILLLDEPFAGVHPQLIEKIVELMKHIRAQGKCIVFIEHNIEAVRSIAEQIIVMSNGRIITQGPPEAVLERPDILEAYLV